MLRSLVSGMKELRRVIFTFLCVVTPEIAQADVGIPMLAVLWPISWIAFIPVVIIEASIAKRILGLMWKQAVIRTGIANTLSTIVGIPLTWGVLLVIQIVVGGGRAYGLDTFQQKLFAVVIQAPWLIPYKFNLGWMIPFAVMVLLIPCFFVSVFTERWIFDRKKQLNSTLVRAWSWKANFVTYGIMELLFVSVLCYKILKL